MNLFDVIEELEVFKQVLLVNLRCQHCLIADAECFDEDIIMGLLHQERSTMQTLDEIIDQFESLLPKEEIKD